VGLIEPGFIKTNFVNAMAIAKKAQDPSSPYSQMMQRIQANSSEMAKNYGLRIYNQVQVSEENRYLVFYALGTLLLNNIFLQPLLKH